MLVGLSPRRPNIPGKCVLSTEAYRAIFEASPDGIIVVDETGRIRDVNPQTSLLFGWPRAALIGESVDVLVPDSLRSGHARHRGHFADKPSNRPMGIGLDLLGRRKDGSTFPIEIGLSPWSPESGERWVICSVRDISARKRLQNFSEGAMRATEEERRRIARELHDDTAQRLATLILRVRVLADEGDGRRRARLHKEIREEIVQASDGVRRMARGLRPPELEEVGLVAALTAHFRSLNEGTGFKVHADLHPVDNILDLTARLAVYRIVQEGISNAKRHGGVGEATVSLRHEDVHVVAEISDAGRGFMSSGLAGDGRGLGLVGMHERAAMIGAGLSVDSAPGKGTHIRVWVPCNGDEA